MLSHCSYRKGAVFGDYAAFSKWPGPLWLSHYFYVFSLGNAGEGSCDLEVPLYVGWGVNTGNSSHLIGHEVGHTLGLVQPVAPNHDLTDNVTHSVNDEIENGERGTLTTPGNSAFYLVDKTFYRQDGVTEPVVNPLLTGRADG